MATNQRQSLKDLQERLAVRLAAAKQMGTETSWLAVEAGGRRYLLPLVQAGEIFPMPVIQPVPYTQRWFCGVAALRGGLMGVVSLAGLLGSDLLAAAVDSPKPDAKLVGLNAALGVNAVIQIDCLVGLRGPSMFVGVKPRGVGELSVFSQKLLDLQGDEWQELNLQALAEWPEFLSVVA